ncbi:sensor domain-containing diguanylate cyclase [Nocardia sp. BMG51109]|uniref:sensor domain-containing diguanylate cyclase n=1 Tax=Nocardia sp. BMG51109 TaxID=1056816 RepID=UPI0006851952|nr:sensor domain-containing diguanylate cyclase [Nocardia sp. BMG51109]
MDEVERTALARAWWEALAATGTAPMPAAQAQRLLHGLIVDLLAVLHTDPFDAAAGAQVGRALVAAHWTDSSVPALSARVLHRLADHDDYPDSGSRFAALLAAIGQGHEAGVRDLSGLDRHPAETAAGSHDRSGDDGRFRIVFDNIAVAVALGDTTGTLVEANKGLADMIGVPVGSLRGISVFDFAHPDDRGYIRKLLYEELVPARSGTVRLERRLVRADGSVGWMSFAITYVPGSGRQPDYLLAVGADVTELHERQEELHRQARHDALTGLPNRRLLLERVDELIANAHDEDRAAFCFADLDHFKDINDRYGHGIGDKALAAVAVRLRDYVRECDCLVARIGGDEFVALIPPPATASRATIVADRLLSALAEPIVVDGRALRISASIGAVVTPIVGADAESLLDAADTSLYYAKTNGKGHWVLHTLEAPSETRPRHPCSGGGRPRAPK